MPKFAALVALTFIALTPAIAAADEPPSNEQKKKKSDKTKSEDGSSGCSVVGEEHAILGLSAFVLLVSGAALRRRS